MAVSDEILLRDVNLVEVSIPPESAKVVLQFLDMKAGDSAGTLVCAGLIAFKYENVEDGYLPAYVGEVRTLPVSKEAIRRDFENVASQFDGKSEAPGKLVRVQLEGNVTIDILCRSVELVP
jgi:hypothetical protein